MMVKTIIKHIILPSIPNKENKRGKGERAPRPEEARRPGQGGKAEPIGWEDM